MVYIIHLEEKFGHSQHYVGYCDDDRFHERIAEHSKATWERGFMGKVNSQKIKWKVARIFEGADENLERRIKFVWKNTKRICPCCTENPITPSGHTQVSDLKMWERYWEQKLNVPAGSAG